MGNIFLAIGAIHIPGVAFIQKPIRLLLARNITYLYKKLIRASMYEIPSRIEDRKNSLIYSENIGSTRISPCDTSSISIEIRKRRK